MAKYRKYKIYSDEKRHKCHFCGGKRYESFMKKLRPIETKAVSQFNNNEKCWACINCGHYGRK